MPFGTTYVQIPSTKTADYSVVAADDVVVFNPTTTALTCTLPTPNGNFAADSAAGGLHRIVNSGTNILLIAVAAGTNLGPTILYPNQQAIWQSDGVSLWICDSPPPAQGFLQVALSAAQILGMNATPVSLIATPGAARIIVVDHIVLKMVRTSTQFASGGAVEWRYTNGAGAKVSADVSASVVTGAAGTAYSAVRGVTTELVPVADAAIVVTNATGAFTTGTGVGQVSITYRVVTP